MCLSESSIYSTALKMPNKQKDATAQERKIFGYFHDPAKVI
jgi:hypothetical protein